MDATTIAPALINGLLGLLEKSDKVVISIKDAPEGSMPTFSKTRSGPKCSRAYSRAKTLTIL